MNNPDPMKYCPDCHKKMVILTSYSRFCDEIGETVTVDNCRPYLACPDGCIAHVPGEVYLDGYRQKIQDRIEEWIFENTHSFAEFSKKFYTKKQALVYIRSKSKTIKCDDKRFDPHVMKNVFNWFIFHVNLCGQSFYLKKSVQKYCETGKGWFPLSEGF